MKRFSFCLARQRVYFCLAVVGAIALSDAVLAGAFAEERVDFRDPYTQEVVTGSEVSSLHFDLTYALALAAGFAEADAKTLQVYDQLVDSVVVGDQASAGPYYSNVGGSFYPAPDPSSVCPPTTDTSKVAWPLWGQMEDTQTAITSRYGPYMPFFHFPHKDGQEVQALHDWGWGLTNDLMAYEAYAWGAASFMNATCRYKTPLRRVNTTIQAGTLAAFGTYLHSLADSYSHDACIVELVDNRGLPWATHSLKIGLLPNIYACDYNPNAPNNDDAHGREFGQAHPEDSGRMDAAVQAIYAELAARGLAHEGRYAPLGMGRRLLFMDGRPTLQVALKGFVHDWEWNQAPGRRAYTDDLVRALLGQRYGVFVPLVTRGS